MAKKRKRNTAKRKAAKRPPSRPRIFDTPEWPDIQKKILGYVRGVHYIEDAVVAAGLSERWWYKWQARADEELDKASERMAKRGGDDIMHHVSRANGVRTFVQFVQAVRQARAESTVAAAAKVKRTNPLEYLARTQPDKWGRKDRMPWIDPDQGGMAVPVIVYLPDNQRGPKSEQGGGGAKGGT